MRDIARAAEVHTTTVSMALHNSPPLKRNHPEEDPENRQETGIQLGSDPWKAHGFSCFVHVCQPDRFDPFVSIFKSKT